MSLKACISALTYITESGCSSKSPRVNLIDSPFKNLQTDSGRHNKLNSDGKIKFIAAYRPLLENCTVFTWVLLNVCSLVQGTISVAPHLILNTLFSNRSRQNKHLVTFNLSYCFRKQLVYLQSI